MTTKTKLTLTQRRKAFEKAALPSEILNIALMEFRAIEKNPKFIINMGNWIYKRHDKRCEVCLAGAVVCGLYPSQPKELSARAFFAPEDFELVDEVSSKMRALNYLRVGKVKNACCSLKLQWSLYADVDLDFGAIDYEVNKVQWYKEMKQLVKDLRKNNL